MIGDLSDIVTGLRILQVPVEPLMIMMDQPAIMPVALSIIREGDRSAPGFVVGHGVFVTQKFLPEPEILQLRLV